MALTIRRRFPEEAGVPARGLQAGLCRAEPRRSAGAEARPRPGVRRPSRLHARRRLQAHRLEGLQAAGQAAAAPLRRGAGSSDLPLHRFEPVDARAGEVRPGPPHRRGALLHRPGASRPRHDPAVRQGRRATRRSRAAARAASSACSKCSSAMETEGATSFREAFMQFASRTRQQGLAVVISDFLDPDGFESGLKMLASMGHDIFVVHVASAADQQPRCDGRRAVRGRRDRRDSGRRRHAGACRKPTATPGRRTPRSSRVSAAGTTSATSAPTPKRPSTPSSSRRSARAGSSHEFRNDGRMAGAGPDRRRRNRGVAAVPHQGAAAARPGPDAPALAQACSTRRAR